MTTKPKYFDEIQKKASGRWDQLDKDPELAAPWRQLFKQVQSPRHVLSELLQNADDAEATKVTVEIENGYFSFTHNGKDFSKEDFASLCRFGYSNKRMLRTIGFRGIGFKSTFSLGDTVELRTPSLTVSFGKNRFTQPVWLDGKISKNGTTVVRVKIQDSQRQKELENNISEWLSSPFSLLFFNHIRHLKLGADELHWKSKGDGPALGSELMQLQGDNKPHLVIRSISEPFPKEALQEIYEERLLDMGEQMELPPCKVEIVLGTPGKLFVVLPTGVKTRLPFAVNAPFIQDPARLKIKDPEISFTNRWLLQRVGELAAEAMMHWLNRKDLGLNERAEAYDLLPDFGEENASLESICETAVEDAFSDNIKGQPFVLTEKGGIEKEGKCLRVLPVFWNIWNADQILSVLSGDYLTPSLLSSIVSPKNQQKLVALQAVRPIHEAEIQNILMARNPPLPDNRPSLLELWNFASQWKYSWKNKDLNIYPVRGQKVLYSARDVVRLGEKKLLQSEEDWEFLAKYLFVIDVNWLRYLSEQKRLTEETKRDVFEKIVSAEQLLSSTGLDKPSNIDLVMAKVAEDFFAQKQLPLNESIRITQIAAKLNAKIGNEFKFWTSDDRLRSNENAIIFDPTGSLEEIIPEDLRVSTLLHPSYSKRYISCSKEEWRAWLQSDNTWVKTFIPITKQPKNVWGRTRLEKELESRGYVGAPSYAYKSHSFIFEDLDFPKEYWEYWSLCAEENPSFWGQLLEHLLKNPKSWNQSLIAYAYQVAANGSIKSITTGQISAAWLLKFQQFPCLLDTRGQYRRPAELMCRTPETEPHMGIEPFVNAKLDKFEVRELLIHLGVRTTPSGPKQILERLRALSKIAKPPITELMNMYERLDKSFEHCSTSDQHEIRDALRAEALIFTEDGSWQASEFVFIMADENDAPGAALIHSLASQLAIWRKVGVNERPTADLAIEWLMQRPVDEKLPAADVRRIRALLGRHPARIWNQCERWLNLSGEWVDVDKLHYALTMQSLVSWGRLHEWAKTETADFQSLSVDIARQTPFSTLPTLASQIEKRLEKPAKKGSTINVTWLTLLGELLTRIKLDDEILTHRVHEQAERLKNTASIQVEVIQTIPYLNGKPAGLAEIEPAAWVGETLYFTRLTEAKRARIISEIVAKAFEWTEMQTILSYCYDRSEAAIRAYLMENFELEKSEVKATVKTPIKATAEATDQAHPEVLVGTSTKGETPMLNGQNQVAAEEGGAGYPPPVVENGGEAGKPSRETPSRTKSPEPQLIEKFAIAQGFHKNGNEGFAHKDGRVLIKSEGIFHWEMISPNGAPALRYWVKEHCLEAKPLEMPTEIWHVLENTPKQHLLLLEDRGGAPVAYLGSDLLLSKQQGRLMLHPAMYRIVLEADI